MAERCLNEEFQLRNAAFELWVDGGPDTWWLATNEQRTADLHGVPLNTVLTGDEFKPPLTQAEINAIYDVVLDYYCDDYGPQD